MTTYRNKIIIGDPVALQATLAAMGAIDRGVGFANALTRLIDLFTGYLAVDTPADRRRVATLWHDAHEPNSHDFLWHIYEESLSSAAAVTERRTLLAGGLHYHASDRTWGIHT